MKQALLDQAVRNNALWCNAVCAAHGKPGAFTSVLWSSCHGTPPYYPDAITLTPNDTASQQTSIVELVQADDDRSWSVKDSYARLSLDDLGFKILFDAEWIAISANNAVLKKISNYHLTWQRIVAAADLSHWKTAWNQGNSTDVADEIFQEALLSNADIAFVLAMDGDVPIGGAVLNQGAGVVGVSNVFAFHALTEAVWDSLVAAAATTFPDQPLVGYERDMDLEAAKAIGFRTVGSLRVWLHKSRTTTMGEFSTR